MFKSIPLLHPLMPTRKKPIDYEEYNVEPVKRLKKKKTESFIYDFDSVDLSKTVYEHLYNHNDILNYNIHKKKYEEAEKIFETAISSNFSNICIILKGPTGCGKGFLSEKLLDKYRHIVRSSVIDLLPEVNIPFNITSSKTFNESAFKCANTLFPSLSFSRVTPIKLEQSVDQRKVVTRLTDAHFYSQMSKDYNQVRKSIETLKSHSGILLVEMTDFEFEGSMQNYILKIFNETFTNNIHVININTCTPTALKNTLKPIDNLLDSFNLSSKTLIEQFTGDPRAFMNDLYILSLRPDLLKADSLRDYRTDFFHYVGKLLYPSKTGARIFEEISFWDLDFNLYLIFLQFYFPKFCSDIKTISTLNDYFCLYDNISWKVLNHVSIENHINACKYTPLLACFLFVNNLKNQSTPHKFFSFNRPPKFEDSNNLIRKNCRKNGIRPDELNLYNSLSFPLQ